MQGMAVEVLVFGTRGLGVRQTPKTTFFPKSVPKSYHLFLLNSWTFIGRLGPY